MRPQMQFERYELKYYLPEALYPQLKRLIQPYMTLDPYLKKLGSEAYLVRSLYLDTDDLRFYHEKLAGAHTRRKFRVRGYNDVSPEVFLEIKGRHNQIVVKERTAVRYEELERILDRYGGYFTDEKRSVPEAKTLNTFLFFVPALQLRPTVLVAYEREAFMGSFDDRIRLTIDRHLRCLPGQGTELFHSGSDWIPVPCASILELKFNRKLPFFFHRLIQELNLWAQAISKYCLCLEKCDPACLR